MFDHWALPYYVQVAFGLTSVLNVNFQFIYLVHFMQKQLHFVQKQEYSVMLYVVGIIYRSTNHLNACSKYKVGQHVILMCVLS